jgi:hypothetical protein
VERLESRVVPGFVAPLTFDAGSRPEGFAVGDFTGNGIPDVAVANYGSNNVSVLLGNGDGTFQPARNFAAGDNPTFVVAADFRHNGILDLAVVNTTAFGFGAPGVSVLLGNGDGTFQTRVTYFAGTSVGDVAVGDFRHSGDLDLAVTTSNGVSLLFGNGDGTFQAPVMYPAGPPVPGYIAAAELTGDGNLDLVVINYSSNSVTVLLGNGDGTFQPPRSFPAGPSPTSLQVGDLRSNGIPDVVVANNVDSGTVSVLFGNGDGTFQSPVSYPAGHGTSGVVLGDFTSNGILDLVYTNNGVLDSGGVHVLLGNGDGTFRPGGSFLYGGGSGFMGAADLRRDGRIDLLLSGVLVLLGNGDGTFEDINNFATTERNPYAEAIADFNGDGIPDLAVANLGTGFNGGSVSVLLGNGDGTFQPAQNVAFGFVADSVAVGDFNGDGIPDLAVALDNFNPSVEVLLGNGDGTFQAAVPYNAGNHALSVAVGDFTGSGILDLVVANYLDNNVSVLFGNGDGTFQAPRNFNVGTHPRSVTVGHFTGNDIMDIAVANGDSNNVSVLLGNGDGSFQPARNYAVGRDPYSVAVADLTGTGIADLVVADAGDIQGNGSGVSVLLGNGDGTFRTTGMFAAGDSPYSVTVGDFYGDGIPALAVAGGGGTRVLRGNGDGTFQNPHFSYTTGYSTSVVSGDFHGDGLPDLAVTNAYFDRVLLLNNDGHGQSGRMTPRGERSPSTLANRRGARAAAGVVAPEAIPAAPRAAATPPGATGRLVDDSRPLLGRDAETLWASAARPAARGSEPTRRALAGAGSRPNRAAPWVIDHLFVEPDGSWLW